jgi:hypothetical protein
MPGFSISTDAPAANAFGSISGLARATTNARTAGFGT